jgi:hypothetical protein
VYASIWATVTPRNPRVQSGLKKAPSCDKAAQRKYIER